MIQLCSIITYGAETWPLRKGRWKKTYNSPGEKNPKEDYGPVKDINIDEWRIRSNRELELIFHKRNILQTIKLEDYNGLDMHGAVRTPYYMQYWKITQKKETVRKTSNKMWRFNQKDVEEFSGRSDWKERAADRNYWEVDCLTGWS